MTKTKISVGDKFNRLTVTGRVSEVGAKNTKWAVTCDCGNTTAATTIALTGNRTKSCGCYRDEFAGTGSKTHGRAGTREYNIWCAMKQRCYDPKKDGYGRYGGRGIKVCDEWLHSFETFYKDMGDCPKGLTLERKDCNGNYEASNCEWASRNVQGFNTNVRANNKTGRTGVYFNKLQNQWTAAIGAEGKLAHLGTFASFELAVAARVAGEVKYYGYSKE